MNMYDPGHGGSDPGAVANGLRESDINLEVSKLASAFTRGMGVHIGLSRTDDTSMEPVQRIQLVTAPNIKTVVSIHCNAASDPNVRGFEIFVSNFNTKSLQLGQEISQMLMTRSHLIPPRNPAIKTRLKSATEDYYYIINEPRKKNIPSVLVEIGFLTNMQDASVLSRFWDRYSIAYLISAGVKNYSDKYGQ